MQNSKGGSQAPKGLPWPAGHRPENHGSRVALLPEKFLLVQKVFAHMIKIIIQKTQFCLVTLNNFTDNFKTVRTVLELSELI